MFTPGGELSPLVTKVCVHLANGHVVLAPNPDPEAREPIVYLISSLS